MPLPAIPAAAAVGKGALWGASALSGLWAADSVAMKLGLTDRGESTQLAALGAIGDAVATDPLRQMRMQDQAMEAQEPYIRSLATHAELRNELAELVGARSQMLGQLSMQSQMDLGYINRLIQEGLF